ncbi:MAG: hypothetical protein ABI791_14700 [Acidobacteriota bacterium]
MYLLRKMGVSVAALAFTIGLFAATSNAQYRTRSRTYAGTVYTQPQYNRQWRGRNYRSNRISPWQYRRMQQRRYWRYRNNNNDYYNRRLSWWERRRLAQRYNNRDNGRRQYRVRNW